MNSVPILTYHGLVKGKANSSDGMYTLGEETFQGQIAYLSEKGFHALSLENLRRWLNGESLPERPVVITFDDGKESDVSIALPILKRHRFEATFFVNPGTLDGEGFLKSAEVRQLQKEGMEIGSHGFHHLFLTGLDAKTLEEEVAGSKKTLEELLGKEVSFFAIPRGRFNRSILEVVRQAGYRVCCTSDIGFTEQRSNPFRLKRWAMKRPYQLEDFVSVVEGRPRKRLIVEHTVKRSAYRLLGHTLYETVRKGLLREK